MMARDHNHSRLHASIAVWLMVTIGGCISNSNPPSEGIGVECNSVEEFIQLWTNAYEKNDRAEMSRLLFSQDLPKPFIESNLDVLMTFAGKHRVTDPQIDRFRGEMKPYLYEGQELLSNVQPQWMVSVVTKGNEGYEGGESKFTAQFAVGESTKGRYGIVFGELVEPPTAP